MAVSRRLPAQSTEGGEQQESKERHRPVSSSILRRFFSRLRPFRGFPFRLGRVLLRRTPAWRVELRIGRWSRRRTFGRNRPQDRNNEAQGAKEDGQKLEAERQVVPAHVPLDEFRDRGQFGNRFCEKTGFPIVCKSWRG